MKFGSTPLAGAYIVELEPHRDERGFFARSFCAEEFASVGLPTEFPQCNISWNERAHTLRGMHWQAEPHGEAKLVRCTAGAIYDVIVDLRPDSSTRNQFFGIELTARHRTALLVPIGFAHGFQTLTDETEVFYQMSTVYRPESARGFRFDDPEIGIDWPREPSAISDADQALPRLVEALCESNPEASA